MFDATKRKFPDLRFDTLDLDRSRDEAEKYNVHSIPRVVFLDDHDKVIWTGSPQRDEQSFAEQVQSMR